MVKRPDYRLDRSPLHLMHRVSQLATEMFQRELEDIDLTPRQLVVMMAVGADEGLSHVAIVERSGVDRSTLSDVMKRLQERGWMQQQRTKRDARAYAVKVTTKGRSVLVKAAPLLRKVDEQILAALSGRGGEEFMDGLAAIVTKLDVK